MLQKKKNIYKVQIRVGVCALLWAMWNNRNDYIFNNTKSTYLCRLYILLLIGSVCGPPTTKEKSKDLDIGCKDLDIGCNRLEKVAWDIYIHFS
jgi:hypothetical protein